MRALGLALLASCHSSVGGAITSESLASKLSELEKSGDITSIAKDALLKLVSEDDGVQADPSKAVNNSAATQEKDEPSQTKSEIPPGGEFMAAKGQHLLLDLAGSSFEVLNDEKLMKQATLNIVERAGMTLLGIDSFKLEPQGVSVCATLAESHLTIHTWPEHGEALVDLFTCGEGFNLQEAIPIVVDQYGGKVVSSTFSVVPRGNWLGHTTMIGKKEVEDPEEAERERNLVAQFQPFEIMATHKYKKKIFEKESEYQHIAIWDHHDMQADDYGKQTTRSLFLDNVLQSNIDDEQQYHETLVHPAFIASPVPPKRVLILGGGEGGALREALKWKSVEKVTMVEIDEVVIEASREFLPSYSNCTLFGAASCFDDERTELFIEDFFGWFEKHIGNDICEKHESKKESLYDIVVLDLPEMEELREGDYLYSDTFFKRISCALSPTGVVVTNFGEAPLMLDEGPDLRERSKEELEELELYQRKMTEIQTMSKFFKHTRVYDTPISSFRANWAFAIGIIPDGEANEATKHSVIEALHHDKNVGDFDASPNVVNDKLRNGLHESIKDKLSFYNGAIHHGFQYSTADWIGAYCADPENEEDCKSVCTDADAEEYGKLWHPIGESCRS